MSNSNPVAGYVNSGNARDGKWYFYRDDTAGDAVAASMSRLQNAIIQSQYETAQAARGQGTQGERLIALTTAASIATIVGGVAAAGSLGVGAVGAAAGVASAASGIASTALAFSSAESGTPVASAEITYENRTPVPVVPYHSENGGCSVAEECEIMMPGGSSTVLLLQPNGFSSGRSEYGCTFAVGSTGVFDPTSSTIISARTVDAFAGYAYQNDDWIPVISCAGMDSPVSAPSGSLAALCYLPDEGVDKPDFTIVTTGVQKSVGAMKFNFIPGSIELT